MKKSKMSLLASASVVAFAVSSPAFSQSGWVKLGVGTKAETFSWADTDTSYDITDDMSAFGGEIGFRLPALSKFSFSINFQRATGSDQEVESYAEFILPAWGHYAGACESGPCYPAAFYADEFEASESSLETIDLEVGMDIGVGSGSRVTFGVRQASIMHLARGSYEYEYYYPPYDTYTYTYETSSNIQGQGVRVAGEFNFAVSPKISVMTEAGVSLLSATGKQRDIAGEDGYDPWYDHTFTFWENVPMTMVDVTLGVGYNVTDNFTIIGGWTMTQSSVIDVPDCRGSCDMTFDHQGIFATGMFTF